VNCLREKGREVVLFKRRERGEGRGGKEGREGREGRGVELLKTRGGWEGD